MRSNYRMEIDRQRIQDDLRGIVRGDVLCDAVSTTLYSTDASIYEIQPVGIVRPRSAADVVALVQYAGEQDLPIHPRGRCWRQFASVSTGTQTAKSGPTRFWVTQTDPAWHSEVAWHRW